MKKMLLNGILLLCALIGTSISTVYAHSDNPLPLSEYVEQTSPGTLTFLSYPKYYRNAENKLVSVDTTFRQSSNPDWDYEVTTGIWTLRIREDGTYQFEHADDILAFKFLGLGIGRGNSFHALDLGVADWSKMTVLNDTVTWNDVFPDVDVKVRYIHDILKVDVIIGKALRNQIERESGEYVTARFDVPQAVLRSQPKQGGVELDLYKENPDLAQVPVVFEKNNSVVHKLRPVETYVVDSEGKRIKTPSEIRSVHSMRLNSWTPGTAEISARLSDISDAPEGDLVLDPSIIIFGLDPILWVGSSAVNDTYIDGNNPTSNYGSSSVLKLGKTSSNERHILISINNDNNIFDKLDCYGQKVTAKIGLYYFLAPYPATQDTTKARFYKATSTWDESTVTWNSSVGIDSGVYGSEQTLYEGDTSTSTYDEVFDVSAIFNDHIEDTSPSLTGLVNKGFLLKISSSTNLPKEWEFYSTEGSYVDYRPYLQVNVGYELVKLDGIGSPYSEGPAHTVWFNNKWYCYFNGVGQESVYYNAQPQTYAIEFSDTDGLATNDISNIQNNILRKRVGSPTPAATGTPHPVFGPSGPYVYDANVTPHVPTIVPNSNDWYVNMAAFMGNWVETNVSGTPVRIHGAFHAEDTHDENGQPYEEINGATQYVRVGYVRSTDPFLFSQVDTSTVTKPAVEHFVSELEWRYPPLGPTPDGNNETPTPIPIDLLGHIDGVPHPRMYPKGDYVYIFYDRGIPLGWARAVETLTPTPNPALVKCLLEDPTPSERSDVYMYGKYLIWSNICVARASKSDLQAVVTPTANPWKNYYDGGYSEPAVGGWSTPIFSFDMTSKTPFRSVSTVTFNKYLNQDILLVGGDAGLQIYTTTSSDLSSWGYGMALPLNDFLKDPANVTCLYSYFVSDGYNSSKKGSVHECGQRPWLYFMRWDMHNKLPINDILVRTKVRFSS